MNPKIKSIRPFIGAKDFAVSRAFYSALGFEETEISSQLSVFRIDDFAFYLQNAFVKDWVDNTMVFLEVENVNEFWQELLKLKLDRKFERVKIIPIKVHPWGQECFIHDPSGVLWHIGEFIVSVR